MVKKKKKTLFLAVISGTIILILIGGAFLLGKNNPSRMTNYSEGNNPSKEKNKKPSKSPLPPPYQWPNNNFSNKTLAKAIKDDLKDALINKSRWDSGYFNDYLVYDKGNIWCHDINDNKNLTRKLTENFSQNYSKRKTKYEKEREDWENQGYTWPKSLDNDWEKKEAEMIWLEELEFEDYREIVNLVFWIKCLAKAENEKEGSARYEKFARDPNCFYWGKGGTSTDKVFIDSANIRRKYYTFYRWENQKVFSINIPENHLSLNDFSFQKRGFYLISGLDKLSWEPSPYNGQASRDFFVKWVNLNDNITITFANF